MKRVVAVAVLAGVLASVCRAEAKSLEDILKERGVITEEDYKEAMKSRQVNYTPGRGFTFVSADEKFRLQVGGRLQARYSFIDRDQEAVPTGVDTSEWRIRRMKFYLNGYAYSKNLTYRLQLEAVNGGNSRLMDDAWLNYRFMDGVQLQVGQWKTPFTRQELTSAGALQFVDRAHAQESFTARRDIGAMVHGKLFDGLTYYNVGVFGGAGQSNVRTTNNNMFLARVAVNPLGDMPYGEADLEGLKKPLLSLGANYFYNTLVATRSGTTTSFDSNAPYAGSGGWLGRNASRVFTSSEKVDVNSLGFDAAFKWQGLSLQGEYLLGQADGQSTDRTVRAHGFYGQAGYMVIPKKLEVAVRHSYVDPDRDRSNDTVNETQGAVSYYIVKHHVKLQGDVTASHDQSRNRSDDMVYRLQAQLEF